MQVKSLILFYRIFFIFFIICMSGCGYKPMSYYANQALGEKVHVELIVNLENPEESVKIKDMVNEAIVSRFHSRVVNRSEADSILTVDVQNIQDTIIGTNTQGIATFYRVFLNISFSFKRNDKKFNFVNQGYYDYAASLNSPTITYENRSNAIIEAARQSLDRFISQIGYSASF
ncbi:LPS assembly lipoprotein LptE [Helicobacter trogontum]|nr:LPS assembly lipoprotein LptE [Helicobacter trogontum]MCI5786410.1 LPS assembly lipoprotein LptE [Helicobacter trogontum]MDY5184906.1 LPS assembly lipoprotein LptE [Helicobacter trogontum]